MIGQVLKTQMFLCDLTDTTLVVHIRDDAPNVELYMNEETLICFFFFFFTESGESKIINISVNKLELSMKLALT